MPPTTAPCWATAERLINKFHHRVICKEKWKGKENERRTLGTNNLPPPQVQRIETALVGPLEDEIRKPLEKNGSQEGTIEPLLKTMRPPVRNARYDAEPRGTVLVGARRSIDCERSKMQSERDSVTAWTWPQGKIDSAGQYIARGKHINEIRFDHPKAITRREQEQQMPDGDRTQREI